MCERPYPFRPYNKQQHRCFIYNLSRAPRPTLSRAAEEATYDERLTPIARSLDFHFPDAFELQPTHERTHLAKKILAMTRCSQMHSAMYLRIWEDMLAS